MHITVRYVRPTTRPASSFTITKTAVGLSAATKICFGFCVSFVIGSREADWSDLESEVLVGVGLDGDVLDGEGFQVFGFDFENTASPRVVLDLAFFSENFSNILDVGGFILVGEDSEFSVGVLAVVGNVLSNTFALHTEHLNLNMRGGVLDHWFILDFTESPDIFVVAIVLCSVNTWSLGPDAGLVVGGVAVDKNCIMVAASVRIDPVVT